MALTDNNLLYAPLDTNLKNYQGNDNLRLSYNLLNAGVHVPGKVNNGFDIQESQYHQEAQVRTWGNLPMGGSSQLTLALWIKTELEPDFFYGSFSVWGPFGHLELAGTKAFGTYLLHVNGGAGGATPQNFFTPAGVWHFLVLRDNGANFRIMVDMTNIYDIPLTSTTPYADNYFALESGGTSGHVYCDEIAFWNRALSDGELSSIWNNGNGISYSALYPGQTATPVAIEATGEVSTPTLAYGTPIFLHTRQRNYALHVRNK